MDGTNERVVARMNHWPGPMTESRHGGTKEFFLFLFVADHQVEQLGGSDNDAVFSVWRFGWFWFFSAGVRAHNQHSPYHIA